LASTTRALVAASALALLWNLGAGRYETPVFLGVPSFSAPDSAGFRWGEPILLEPGRYRARVSVTAHAPSGAPAAEHVVWLGFVPGESPWHPQAFALRPLDLRRDASRAFDLAVDAGESRTWRMVWRDARPASGVRIERLEVMRETPVWKIDPRLSGGAAWPVRFAMYALWLAVAIAAASLHSTAASPRGGLGRAAALAFVVYALTGSGSAALESPARMLAPQSTWRTDPSLAGAAVLNPAAATALALAAAALTGLLVRRRPILAWMVPAAAIGWSFAGTLLGPRSDFQVYYAAGLAVWSGVNPYAIGPERVLNPPPFVLACAALPAAPLAIAGFLWFGFKLVIAACCVPLARGALVTAGASAIGSTWWARPEWIALLASARYLAMDLRYGNTNVLVLFLLLAGAASCAAGRGGLSAIWVALGIAVKVTPLWIPVAGSLGGQRKWAVAIVLLAVLLIASSSIVLERLAPGAGLGFWREAVPRPGDVSMGRVDNQSLRGMTDRFVGGAEVRTRSAVSIPSLQMGGGAARVAEVGLVLLVLLAVGRSARRVRIRGNRADWADLWGTATIALLLTSPGSWTVHFGLLYLPLTVLADRARGGDRAAAATFVALAALLWSPAFSRWLNDHAAAWSLLTLASLVALVVIAQDRPAPAPGAAMTAPAKSP
jgi:hypothetical protein